MSPSKYHNHQHSIINGPRPSPLKINRGSQLIHKQSFLNNSSSSSSSSVLASTVSDSKQQQQHQVQRNNPVIIYTHSPKVIHTQARDFMALVQKLTGLSSSRNDEKTLLPTHQRRNSNVADYNKAVPKSKHGNSSDDDENCGGGGGNNNNGGNAVVGGINSHILNPPRTNSYNFADIPLFTPTSVDYFCSQRPVYAPPTSIGNSISPSVLEFIKGFPEC